MKYLLLLTAFIFVFKMSAQDFGKPFLNHFTPKEYNAYSQNWGMAQDERGVLYVGNFDGVLEYDGANWRLIKVSNGSTVNSLAVGKDNRVYVAAVSEFGFLAPDRSGNMIYKSLVPKIDKKHRNFQDVIEVYQCADGVYFNAVEKVFFWNGDTISVSVAETEFTHSYNAGGKFYVIESERGLKCGENGILKFSDGGEKYAENDIHAIFPEANGEVLVFSNDEKLATFSGKRTPYPTDLMSKISAENLDFMNNKRVYSAQKLPDGNFAFFSVQYGGLVLRPDGSFVKRLDKKTGLRSEQIHWNLLDRHNGLWLANNSGVSRMELLSPFRFWDESMGLNSMVLSLGQDEKTGKIYAGTFQGCFALEGDFFRLLPGLKRGVWGFKNMKTKFGDFFMVGSSGGLFVLENDELKSLSNIRALSLFVSSKTPERIYAGTPFGYSAFERNEEGWKMLVYHDTLGAEIRSMADDAETEDMWLCSAYNGVLRLELESRTPFKVKKTHHYDTLSGLPVNNWTNVITYRGENLFLTSKGIYKFDRSKNRFFRDASLVKEERDIFRWAEDREGNVWISGITTQKGAIARGKVGENGVLWETLPFKRIPDMGVEVIFPDKDGKVWIGGSEGLFSFDAQKPHKYEEKFNTLLRKVVIGEDSVIFGGTFWREKNGELMYAASQQHAIILPHRWNKIAFHFSAASFEEPKSTLFSCKLEGFDEEWSPWQKDTKTDYTNLPEGKYVFRVKSKNIFGIAGEEASFTFEISPPFYRTWYAYLVYLLFFVFSVRALIAFNTRRLRLKNEALEKVIAERTSEVMEQKGLLELKNAELEQQKEEILVQAENLRDLNAEVSEANKLLEIKNKEIEKAFSDIKSSINYALRIQSAMLPTLSIFEQVFSEFFIFFRPRDVVSGDFYWLEYLPDEEIAVLAVADCTGHGVPGAFMSLIGNDLLDKIILNNRVFDPSEILENLHEGINTSLKQDENGIRDGMDIGICVFDFRENSIRFSGAKQNLIAVSSGEMKEFAGDKVSIGGQRRDKDFRYSVHNIALNELRNTKFYLFTDGIQDQFGGAEGRKITKRQLKSWLVETSDMDMKGQGQSVQEKIEAWCNAGNGFEQIDDMLLIGFEPALRRINDC